VSIRRPAVACLLIGLVAITGCGNAGDGGQRILLGTTHTLEDSGILDSLTAAFTTTHPDAKLQVVVEGSGEIMTIAGKRDLDVILTHSPEDEKAFVAQGLGVERRRVMHNAFVIAGPATDPAHIRQAVDARDAFNRIRNGGYLFISRGDQSGTHRRELAVWRAAGVDGDVAEGWSGYNEGGSGMADVLRIASQRAAYTLTDIATLTALGNTIDVVQLFGGDAMLRNDYSVIVVNNAANTAGGQIFADWITSPAAKELIARFGTAAYGHPLFTAD
jgi:tungstate transport system substrate-binding protein